MHLTLNKFLSYVILNVQLSTLGDYFILINMRLNILFFNLFYALFALILISVLMIYFPVQIFGMRWNKVSRLVNVKHVADIRVKTKPCSFLGSCL